MGNFVLFALAGKLLLYLAKKFPLIRDSDAELFNCNLCLGFWIYLALSLFFKDIDVEQIKNKYVGKFVVSGFTTFIVHLVSIGWDETLGTVYLDASTNITGEG